ncbi:MAG: FG-GAP-like repeat-containing protein [Ignavibacteria bacterium]
MKNLFILSIAVFCYMINADCLFSQTTFTKITTGPIVNDAGISFGCAWGDYDSDGKPDLFIGNMSSAPGERSFLYHNEGNGVFTKVTAGSIVLDSGNTFGGSWGDYDNDGNPDLYVANTNNQLNFMYHNNGGGNFTRVTSGAIVTDVGNSNACCWVDYNNDNYIDMCVTNYGQRRFLYSNNGDGTFTKIITGIFVNEVSPSISTSWGDYNNDGRPDAFTANAGTVAWPNFFFKNDGAGIFTKVTDLNIAMDTGKSFSSSWGDYNNDGFADLFVTNTELRNSYLYKNNGNGTFTRILDGSVATEGSYCVTGIWEDFNNDGWLDLFVTRWQNLNDLLYFNNGDGTFTKITAGDIVNDHGNSFGTGTADYDNDGDADLVVANINNENNFLYQNNATSENTNKWINIKCEGTISNRSAIGARVMVKANINGAPVWQMRDITGQMGYNSQNDLRAHFGLGSAFVIDSIKILWPSGSVNSFTNIAVNEFVTITENTGVTAIVEKKTELVKGFELKQNYPNPFNPVTNLEFGIADLGFVTLKVYDMHGKEVATIVNSVLTPGEYKYKFDGSGYASGIYFYKLKIRSNDVNEFSETKKMILVK